MKKAQNEKIYLRHFWEHATFPWRPRDREAATLPSGMPYFLGHLAQLTRTSIEKMSNSWERQMLTTMLEFRHGALFPSEAYYGFPLEHRQEVASWASAFDRLSEEFGVTRATDRRLKRDLKRYGKGGLVLEEIFSFQFTLEVGVLQSAEGLVVHMQEFPRQHLFRLERDGVPVFEFDDWPIGWQVK